jgi:hypothetical protein
MFFEHAIFIVGRGRAGKLPIAGVALGEMEEEEGVWTADACDAENQFVFVNLGICMILGSTPTTS